MRLRSWKTGAGAFVGLIVVVFVLPALLMTPVDIPIQMTDKREMVLIEGGVWPVGRLEQKVEIPAFYIDRFEVTVGAWRAYAARTGARPVEIPSDEPQGDDYPVRYVSQAEARDFAAWHFKRLPTNAEWDRASRGRGGFLLPWGDAFIRDAANTWEAWARDSASQGVTRVGTYDSGKSDAGVYDMIGNVWEWTASSWRDHLMLDLPPLRVEQLDYAERTGRTHMILRGGSFRTRGGRDRETETIEPAGTAGWDIGFRCVISKSEYERQERLIPWIKDLGGRDPWRRLTAVGPARRKIVTEGRPALPYLRRAARACPDADIRERIDDVIAEIEREHPEKAEERT